MTTALQITGLTKRYGDFLLDHVSFGVPTGSIVGLIGENGAGKSTTIRGVLGMIQGALPCWGRTQRRWTHRSRRRWGWF